MMRLSGSALVAVVAALICSVVTSAQEKPKSGIDSILSNFPGYHLLSLQERDSDAKAFILRHFPKDNPSVVHADFDGDEHMDYALFLRNNKSGATRLVVLLCPGNGQCKSVYNLDLTTYAGSAYIRPVPVGSQVSQTEAIDTPDHTSPAKLKCTGIRVTYFGKGEIVLYWNRKLKKIEEVQTED
jgi:hypothetical protein